MAWLNFLKNLNLNIKRSMFLSYGQLLQDMMDRSNSIINYIFSAHINPGNLFIISINNYQLWQDKRPASMIM